ncbi:hypothetical protein DdX_11191 [Ditylenchus destructor]|uniref:Uncharacterized protein n=1 Tax=Ditylenchus destructor TaxID=166010 RepID=A0AAD4MZK1_9BILA|nr:hypothetical protein DdX_11191 [Ditylenchus destructor]
MFTTLYSSSPSQWFENEQVSVSTESPLDSTPSYASHVHINRDHLFFWLLISFILTLLVSSIFANGYLLLKNRHLQRRFEKKYGLPCNHFEKSMQKTVMRPKRSITIAKSPLAMP